MDIFIKALQLIFALLILVTIHGFGHYITARIFGVKVNRFYLFFNPWFSLLRYNPMAGTLELISRTKDNQTKTLRTFHVSHPRQPRADGRPTWRDTIYGLGWLPLGGYCDIAGMIDETKDASQLESTPQSWEFRSKPAWQRLIVMVAGVVLNFLLAITIYTGIAFHWGDNVVPFQAMSEGLDFSPELQDAGFRNGDILMSLNGKAMDAKDYSIEWDMIQPGAVITVNRQGESVDIAVPDSLIKKIATKDRSYMPMTLRVPVYAAKVVHGEPAYQAGLESGDRILAVANDTTPTLSEFFPALQAHCGQSVEMKILRNGENIVKNITISDAGKIGIQLLAPTEIFDRETVHYSFLQSIPRGWEIGIDRLTSYVSSLGLVFSKEGAQSLGGFGTLGDLFPATWNWYAFWQITAFLSIILAFMNIIPIPGLDGGHTLFLLVEVVTRRKPSDRFLEIANTAGFMFLMLLLIYANGNDIYRFLLK